MKSSDNFKKRKNIFILCKDQIRFKQGEFYLPVSEAIYFLWDFAMWSIDFNVIGKHKDELGDMDISLNLPTRHKGPMNLTRQLWPYGRTDSKS